MAGPVAHIMLALSVLTHYLPEKNARAFIVGTSFPDIRYLGSIKREKTHTQHITFESLKSASSSFQAGLDLHALVDKVRVQYMQDHHVYEMAPKAKYIDTYLKFVEDRILYNKYDNWKQIRQYFDTIINEENNFGIPKKQITQWHQFIQGYCQKKPTLNRSLNLFLAAWWPYLPSALRNFAIFAIKKLRIVSEDIVTQIENDEKLKKIILNFYDNFKTYAKKYQPLDNSIKNILLQPYSSP